jgi:hypothetical protein
MRLVFYCSNCTDRDYTHGVVKMAKQLSSQLRGYSKHSNNRHEVYS